MRLVEIPYLDTGFAVKGAYCTAYLSKLVTWKAREIVISEMKTANKVPMHESNGMHMRRSGHVTRSISHSQLGLGGWRFGHVFDQTSASNYEYHFNRSDWKFESHMHRFFFKKTWATLGGEFKNNHMFTEGAAMPPGRRETRGVG